MPATQNNQPFVATSPLGDNVLLFWRMTGTEAISQPFAYEVEFLSETHDLKPKDLLGLNVQIRVDCPEQESNYRYFHGYVTRFGWIGKERNFSVYKATLRPWLWFLTRTTDCRIFQQKSVPDIIKEVFGDLGFSAYVKDSLNETYAALDYCVQYRETAFQFVSRLMEREGIYYYFTHEDGKHTLVLSDGLNSHSTNTGYDTVPFYGPSSTQRRKRDHFSEWKFDERADTGKFILNDFDFEKPKANLITQAALSRSHALASFEMYDYPGGYITTDNGNTYSTVRQTERQTKYDLVYGEGSVVGVSCGCLFTLEGAPVSTQDRQYLALSVRFDFQQAEYGTSGTGQETSFRSQVEAIPSAQQFRPERVTPPSVVRGVQTAIVVGPSGEEIYTDKYGRIKVQFHWDRKGQNNENSSCWIRVSQTWAGQTWGAIHIPRIGQEVIVDFLEGDPDRPIVTGCVYNADQMPPYTLPDNMTQSGVKTRSSKQGTTDTFNELRFEDKKDSEEIYFHAEKDFNRVVENNDTLKIGYDKKDKGDQSIEIFNNQTLVVGGGEGNAADGSQTITIYKDRTTTIKQGNETLTVETGNRSITISKGNDTHTISKGNQTVTISEGNREVTISKGNDTLTVSQGNQTIDITAGGCTISAGQSIELKVGSSSIKIEPAKITIKSPEIDVQADMQVQIKSAMVQVNGDSDLILKGGMVAIN